MHKVQFHPMRPVGKNASCVAADARYRLERGGEFKDLPPDPEDSNYERAWMAEQALLVLLTKLSYEPETLVTDLLCNLMHWCDRQPPGDTFDFDHALAVARAHYQAETQDLNHDGPYEGA